MNLLRGQKVISLKLVDENVASYIAIAVPERMPGLLYAEFCVGNVNIINELIDQMTPEKEVMVSIAKETGPYYVVAMEVARL